MTRSVIFALLCAASVFLVACQRDALTGENTLNLYSYEDEKKMGDEAVQPILAELGGLYPDQGTQDYVNMVGQKVAAAGRSRLRGEANFPDWEFRFYVVNTSMINAFALPGGHVFVTRGIMMNIKDESELAGLLGHECAHVFARHSAERMSEITLMILPVALLGSVSEGAGAVGMVAVQLVAMKYGRDDETESDHHGMRFAARAGYEPDGIVRVMEMLERYTNEHGGGGPEFLSTHPNPGNRVEYLNEQIKKEYKGEMANAVRNQPQYEAACLDMRQKQPAYELADKGDAAMGAGIEAEGKGDSQGAQTHYRKALGLYQQAVSMVPDHAILHVNVSQAHFYLRDFEAAETSVRNALRMDGAGFWPNFMGGLIAFKRNDINALVHRMENALRLVPESPVGMFYLAVGFDRQGQSGNAIGYYKKAYDSFGGEGELAQTARQRLIDLGEPDPKPKEK
ncbi:Beta-barrel assembly-enhancing protease [Planctomycetaceae bacterium]|nr:Beta-barrel assembly-enhancing protease [Planctomycetaceae bacterium]